MSDKMLFYRKKEKYVPYIFGSLMFVVLGVLFVFNQTVQDEIGLFGTIVGWASIIFFGFGVIVFIWFIILNKPALIIDELGFTDSSTLIAIGFVEWSNVKDIQLYEQPIPGSKNGSKFISVDLYDTAKVLNDMSKLKQSIIKMSKGFSPYPFNISIQFLSEDSEVIIAKMKEHLVSYE